jgi:formiminotetrahydrofolate cyclodeaminase
MPAKSSIYCHLENDTIAERMDDTIEDWLESLAAKQPTPGGGAAAGLLAATAAALVGMVSIYTTGPKWQAKTDRMQAIHDEAAVLRHQALELMAADAAAFTRVGEAYQLPKDTNEAQMTRKIAIQASLVGAAEPPRLTAELAARVIILADELIATGNPNVISDVAVASSTARAALESAIVNIEINAELITDEAIKNKLQVAIRDAVESINKADEVTAAVRQRIKHA